MTALPAVGAPAGRALRRAGIGSLEDVVTWGRRDLLALHGVGPKALGLLDRALVEAGLPPLRDDRP